jgi:peptidoglycan/xylan/chitin deacetylase (PgdA/CDA1 family)
MDIYFTLQVDCESTQRTIDNPALGERAIHGLAEILSQASLKATFVVIPSDLNVHAAVYRELEAQGHEVGLHTHPAEQGYNEFLGTYGFDDQQRIIGEGADMFADRLGHRPLAFTPGYCSANDHTYSVLETLGFRHGTVSLPTRNLPQCACVWGDSPLDAHYPHRYNRCLTGEVDFVDVPPTLDEQSRMWGGAHPQDLRIELVDAKNHWYTLHKNVKRLIAAGEAVPVKYLKATTHNIFDYSDPHDFRRETLLSVIAAARQICEQEGATLVAATTADIAGAYRTRVPRANNGPTLTLDARGRAAWQTNLQLVRDGH